MLDGAYNQDNVMGWQFAEGTPVYDVTGAKVGTISEPGTQGDNLVLQKGLIFPHDYYVPVRTVLRADADSIYLNVTKDDVINQAFDNTAATSILDATTGYNDTAMSSQAPGSAACGNPLSDRMATDTDYSDTSSTANPAGYAPGQHVTSPSRGAVPVPIREEQLNASKQQATDVPLMYEELRLEHVPVRGGGRDIGPDAFTERDIDVPVRGEKVAANKKSRVTEEVRLYKQQVTENQRIGDTVRKERVRIEGEGIGQVPDDVPLDSDTLAYDQNADNAQPRRGI